jgi:UDP:flavonoid glycosyltransferase YjiC (YdhE family)
LATISICFFPVPSAVLNAVALAKRLRSRGHKVWIISTPDVEPAARAEGIAVVPVLGGLFRTGSFEAEIRYFETLSRFAKLAELRRAIRSYRAAMDGLLEPGQNELDHAFDRIAPDLALFYSDIPDLIVAPLVALRRGLRCAYVTPLFSSFRGPDSPPLAMGLVPRPGAWSRFAVRMAWARFLLSRSVTRRLGIALGFGVHLGHYVRKLAPPGGGAGMPVCWDAFQSPMLSLPNFFLVPRELEFDFQPRAGSHWLGWTFDSARPEQLIPAERFDPARPLVYCSLGKQAFAFMSAPVRRAFLQAVLDALAARPHLQLVLGTGGDPGGKPLNVTAPGAIVQDRLPQLQVLGRARLMITHAGTNSLMECASRGVPMIAFPLGFDQQGNAARAVYHGLALRGDFRRVTADSIGRMIDAVLGDEAMRQRCAAMAARAGDAGHYESEMAALEALAQRA